MITIECTSADDPLPALISLARHLPAAPRAYLRKMLKQGKVLRAGVPLREGDKVHAGDLLELPGSLRLQEFIAEKAKKPTILFENEEMLVVAKPAGLAVHSGLGHEEDNLTARVQRMLRRQKVRFRAAPAHRLDCDTSGPVLFGKGRQACAALGEMFMAGAVEKVYQGLAAGHLPHRGELASPVPAKGKWKSSLTTFRRLECHGDHSLLELHLQSGRTHQIRRQLADSGHPLAGDRRYGGFALPDLDRLFLHGCRLALTSPFDGSRLEIDFPLPAELTAVLGSLSPVQKPEHIPETREQ